MNTSTAGRSWWLYDLTQGTDWTRKLDSTPPTPATSVFPFVTESRNVWDGRTLGISLGELELRDKREAGRDGRRQGQTEGQMEGQTEGGKDGGRE